MCRLKLIILGVVMVGCMSMVRVRYVVYGV